MLNTLSCLIFKELLHSYFICHYHFSTNCFWNKHTTLIKNYLTIKFEKEIFRKLKGSRHEGPMRKIYYDLWPPMYFFSSYLCQPLVFQRKPHPLINFYNLFTDDVEIVYWFFFIAPNKQAAVVNHVMCHVEGVLLFFVSLCFHWLRSLGCFVPPYSDIPIQSYVKVLVVRINTIICRIIQLIKLFFWINSIL